MGIEELGLHIGRFLPLQPSPSLSESIARSQIPLSPRAYLSLSLSLSAVLSAYSLALLLSLAFPPPESLSYSLILFALLLSLSLYYPKAARARFASLAESDLPLAMRSAATQLEMRLNFERVLLEIAGSNYGCSPLLSAALHETSSGKSIPSALAHASALSDSAYFKRMCAALAFCYEHGEGYESLRSLSSELISVQQSQAREFSSRLAMIGLLFISASALLPSFFLVFALTSSAFLSSQITPVQIWLAFLVAFPALSLAILSLSLLRSPPFLRTRKQKGIWQEISLNISSLNLPIPPQHFLASLALLSLLLSLLFFLSSLPLLSLLSLGIAPLFLSATVYFSESRSLELDSRLPDALFRASSAGKSVPFERMLSSIADAGYGPLSSEFASIVRQIKSGARVPDALNSHADGTSSLLLSRSLRLLVLAYKGGADMYRPVRATAEDMLSLFSLLRERAGMLSMQKYTLLAACAILVPLILGSVTLAVSGFAKDFAQLSISQGQVPEGLFSSARDASLSYILLFSAITSLFISAQEGQIRRSALYFLSTTPVGAAVFLISSSVNLFGFL